MRVNLTNNMVQYLDENNVWQDWVKVSGGTMVSTLGARPFNSNTTPYGTIQGGDGVYSPYTSFNEQLISTSGSGDCVFTFTFNQPTLVNQLRAQVQNRMSEYPTYLKFDVSADGETYTNIRNTATPATAQTYQSDVNQVIKSFKVTIHPTNNVMRTSIGFIDALVMQ